MHGRRLTLQPGGIASAIFMLLASIVLTSCPISHDIDADSRVLHSHDGSWQLIIPPGAVAEPEKIAVRRLQAAAKGVTESGLERTPIYEFSPDGLVFNVPLLFQCQYDQEGLPEGGIEEKITSFYFIYEDSTLERAPIHLDLNSNVAEVEIEHFSVGILLTWGITLVNEGYITTRFWVYAIAQAVIWHLDSLPDDEARLAEYEENAELLNPFMEKLDQILGTNPIEQAYPSIQFRYPPASVDISVGFAPAIESFHIRRVADSLELTAAVADDRPLEELSYAWFFDGGLDFQDPHANPAVLMHYHDEAAGQIALDVTDMEGFTGMREFPIAEGQFPLFSNN